MQLRLCAAAAARRSTADKSGYVIIQIDKLRITKPVLQITASREKIWGTQAPLRAFVKMAESQCANTTGVNEPRVFRLRNLPADVNRLSAVELLCDLIHGPMAQCVPISLLAYDVDGWLRTEVAIVILYKSSSVLTSSLNGVECIITALIPYIHRTHGRFHCTSTALYLY